MLCLSETDSMSLEINHLSLRQCKIVYLSFVIDSDFTSSEYDTNPDVNPHFHTLKRFEKAKRKCSLNELGINCAKGLIIVGEDANIVYENIIHHKW
jgi:hypothetical protein